MADFTARTDSMEVTILYKNQQQRQQYDNCSHRKNNNTVNVNDNLIDNLIDKNNFGLLIDHGCSEKWMKHVDAIRLSLPLDRKRPTVARRFFCDTNFEQMIVMELEQLVQRALIQTNLMVQQQHQQPHDHEDNDDDGSNTDVPLIYCNPYLRILEYLEEGRSLAPHTDGHKVCESTNVQSTHTLLLFLTNVQEGGETVLMNSHAQHGWAKEQDVVVPSERILKTIQKKKKDDLMSTDHCYTTSIALDEMSDDDTAISLGISPRRGRILIFPHEWPHAGAVCRSLPKIMLRAELTLHLKK